MENEMMRNYLAYAAAITLISGFAAAQSVETQSTSESTVNNVTGSASSQTTKTARQNADGSYAWSKETNTETHSVPAAPPQVVEKSTTTTVTPPPVVEQQTTRRTTTSSSSD